ncbi:DUF3108 domain-containing protein [Tamlana sp. 2201CG12-4]|uniref:DUF3108 domain-containing protein n=1 Tax=Tamlana sp. 2201CG12-4 TaxID=3112582 RepID=UPI002DBA2369|nr:DUF3108 domain-containing protein [Tamlana sp. 2201CG12-4]MEC3908529.1 DUF3108 domain-containing protein [Tamlana sp. 2201CG12-4]
MPRISFFLLVYFFSASVYAQNNAIGFGEKLTYTASYNMSGILTDLAQITMETSPVKTSKATLLRLKCTATTYSKWDNFFKIRDLYESYVNPKTLTPYLYNRDINEGGYFKNMKYTFSHKNKMVKSVLKKKNNYVEKKDVSIHSGTKDIVSTIYNIRLFDYENMTNGSKKTFTILFDREEAKGQLTYLGKETLSTAIGKRECYKLEVGSNTSKTIKGTLWLTSDENKIPVYGIFKIPVGNGELKIKSASGLKH